MEATLDRQKCIRVEGPLGARARLAPGRRQPVSRAGKVAGSQVFLQRKWTSRESNPGSSAILLSDVLTTRPLAHTTIPHYSVPNIAGGSSVSRQSGGMQSGGGSQAAVRQAAGSQAAGIRWRAVRRRQSGGSRQAVRRHAVRRQAVSRQAVRLHRRRPRPPARPEPGWPTPPKIKNSVAQNCSIPRCKLICKN